MPTLHWIGKDKVINHHQYVPFRILEKQYTFSNGEETSNGVSENKIIHGDNLEALKSLLPEYEGKIKCIYIDPPYNTGNEGWVYNDNVNDPKIKKWLGQVVGRESEDLSRHDKWLCMMYPRLKLLHKLLADDGLFFVNLDDTEAFNFKLIADEIFGINNFLANIAWEKRFTRSNNAKLFSSIKDNLFVYRKSNSVNSLREQRNEKADSTYSNPDNDPRGIWTSVSYVNPATREKRPNLTYPLHNPISGEQVSHPTHAWKYSKETYEKHVEENVLYWGIEGKNTYPRLKKFLSEMDGMVPVDLWKYETTGTTDEASKTLEQIFDVKGLFDTPKPTKLIEKIINLCCDNNSIILDSFAGSGTTAHAVLNLNKKDGGKRKFILVEMEDYAETITAERVKRVIKGYGEEKKSVEGTGGDFSYYTLGAPIFKDQDILNEDVPAEKIEEYVWFSETKLSYINQDEKYLLGIKDQTAYYFYYEKSNITTLDENFLRTLKTRANQYIIYADNCLLTKELMQKYNIIFKKIPRDITRF